MAFDNGNFLIIAGANPNQPGPFFIHERENNNGQPGKIITMADGNGDVNEVAQSYIKDGFDPSKIIINGQPASDIFQKGDKPSKNTTPQKAPLDDREAVRRFLVYQNSSPMAMLLDKDLLDTIKYKFGGKKDS